MNWEELQQCRDKVIQILEEHKITASEALYISAEIALTANMSAVTNILTHTGDENKV